MPLPIVITPEVTVDHDLHHEELHGQLIGMSATRFNVEKYGVRTTNSSAANLTDGQAAIDDMPASGELWLPNMYPCDGPLNLRAKRGLLMRGPGGPGGTSGSAGGLILSNDPGDRFIDSRGVRQCKFEDISIGAAAGGATFAGAMWDAGGSSSGNVWRGVNFAGYNDATDLPTLLGLGGPDCHENVVARCAFTRYDSAIDGYFDPTGCGTLYICEQTLFSGGGSGSVILRNPGDSWTIVGSSFEGDADGKMRMVRNELSATANLTIIGCWGGDITGVAAGQEYNMIELNFHNLVMIGGLIVVPSRVTLIKYTANNLIGMHLAGYIQGNGTAVDFAATTGHKGVYCPFVMPGGGSVQFAGTIPPALLAMSLDGAANGGMRLGKTLRGVGTVDPNGSVFGSVGDEYTNTSGAASHVKWVKQTGNNTAAGWVAVA